MNYQCPVCGANLRQRKLAQAVVTRMEIDCPGCKSRVQLNLHQAEIAILLLSCTGFLALAALAYRLQSQELVMAALVAGAAGWVAVQVLERTMLRGWPRYVRKS
jgi:DNA-directed RNA polymerase subunit RPC12/RpoP